MNRIGIIGGSGVYDLPGLTETGWQKVDTPWGAPSDEIFVGRLGDARLAFLPRHGRGHRIAPGDVNYRANVAALKSLGVTDVLKIRPGMVYVSINCYGHDGDWRERPGWEQLAQAVTGMAPRRRVEQA